MQLKFNISKSLNIGSICVSKDAAKYVPLLFAWSMTEEYKFLGYVNLKALIRYNNGYE